ncbi:hypothetical protein A2415_03030 [candidate division WWE3 bacterium RIFOXYC1_FULL_39_7]|uniref:Gfo/Idh/MocA-like oxidoreductase N-terminal domain-containing protein n=2 Tax=Katanobacteria TaxID=422282 RepID=A0A1F4X8J9_UNCKA|nr:MAG: hypothetical protein A2415_03030 [candidate division WWE3 bacterium RIFOXYC1_FULL_39_7]OGC78006.1 MAG: hypothetical protein A2619_02885 [candidate division WWE3 bacterium RIFOXYD1_FULL_39_9]
MVIGCGQVFDKYWVPAHEKAQLVISGIISKNDTQQKHLNSGFPYHPTDSTKNTIEILMNTSDSYGAIALLVPADVRLELLTAILSQPKLQTKKVFIEKPYTKDLSQIKEFKNLIKKYPGRLHFSGKYSYGRADNLIQILSKTDDLPLFINAVMIEGSKYFNKVMDNQNTDLYFKDGPELDLGFHILNISAMYLNSKEDKIRTILINKNTVMDLNCIRPYFLPNLGFVAEVVFTLNSRRTVPLYLQVGKADCISNRHIDFDFKDKRIVQYFTTLDASDPVYEVREDTRELLAKHKPGYLYYSKELSPEAFCKQTTYEQEIDMEINRICMQIKDIREGSCKDVVESIAG